MVLYQITFYGVNNRKKMPLHMLVAKMVFDLCRSRTLVKALNHKAISYPELLRYHTDMT